MSTVQWVFIGAGFAVEAVIVWAWINSPPHQNKPPGVERRRA